MALESMKLLVSPVAGWRQVAARPLPLVRRLAFHTLPWALVPAIGWYVGITTVGWQIGEEPNMRMTPESALRVCLLFYAAMVAGVLVLGYLVHWMASTYAATTSSFAKGVAIVTFTATPFFLAGLLGLYPSLWLDIVIGTVVAGYCIYLLYIGVPIVMNVPPERGFLFASAVIGVALVGIVAAMAGTALLWDFGAEPVYHY
jgi:hypothetical protein